MNRYKEIGDRAEELRGRGRVHRGGWIAELLEEQGLTRGPAPNRTNPRTARCPVSWRPFIAQAIAEWRARYNL